MTPGNILDGVRIITYTYSLDIGLSSQILLLARGFRLGVGGASRRLASHLAFTVASTGILKQPYAAVPPHVIVSHRYTRVLSAPFSPVLKGSATEHTSESLSNTRGSDPAGGADQGCGTGTRSARSDHRFCARSSPAVMPGGKDYPDLAA